MSLPIDLSERAVETFDAICAQIKERFGEKYEQRFEKSTIKVLELVSQNPYLYQATKFDPNIRRALIDKISSVFYEVRQDRIKVLFFWDNRQEPMF